MSRQFEKSIKLFDGKAYGYKVSDYALENGYLDYLTLSKIVGDCVLNNEIFIHAGYNNWELVNGLEEDDEGDYLEVYQYDALYRGNHNDWAEQAIEKYFRRNSDSL